MRHKKLLLLLEILKNLTRPFTWNFWVAGYKGQGFPKCILYWIVCIFAFVVCGLRDIISIILVPDYPPDPEKIEMNDIVTYLDKK